MGVSEQGYGSRRAVVSLVMMNVTRKVHAVIIII